MSTSLSLDTQKQLYSHQLPTNTELSNQIMSTLVPYSQSPLLFPMPVETSSYNYTLQQKLQATKQKLKRNNSKEKLESKRSTKAGKSDANRLINGKSKKNAGNKRGSELKVAKNYKSLHAVKTTKLPRGDCLEYEKYPNENKLNELKSSHCSESIVEITKFPSANNACKPFSEASEAAAGPSHNSKPIPTSYDNPEETAAALQATMVTGGVTVSKVKIPVMPKTASSRKSVYIDLDSAAEQARLKSTILHNKIPETNNTGPVSLNPAMLLSSCPGLSITPIVNELSTVRQTQSSSTAMPPPSPSKNFHFKQLQHLGNSLTITKTEKNGNKKSSSELILLD